MINKVETDKIATDINNDQAKAETIWQEIEAWWHLHFHSKNLVVPIVAKSALNNIILSKTQTTSQTTPLTGYNAIAGATGGKPFAPEIMPQTGPMAVQETISGASGTGAAASSPKPVGADIGTGGANA